MMLRNISKHLGIITIYTIYYNTDLEDMKTWMIDLLFYYLRVC